jgi:hypothetical protein
MRTVKIELKKDEAFAAFAVLSRYAYDGRLEIRGAEEERAMKLLCEALDDELVERFRDDYKRFVAASRTQKDDAEPIT